MTKNKSFVKLHDVVDAVINMSTDTLRFNIAWNEHVSNGERLPETRLQAFYKGVMEHPDFSQQEKEAYLIAGLYYNKRYGWDFSFPPKEAVLTVLENFTFSEWMHQLTQDEFEAFQEQVLGGELR